MGQGVTERRVVEHSLSFDSWILTFIVLWCIGTWVDRYLDRVYPKPTEHVK